MTRGVMDAERAAARIAAAGGSAAEQQAARAAVMATAQKQAVSRASQAGAGVEGATAAAQSGIQLQDQVLATPVEVLQEKSERYRELLAQMDAGREERVTSLRAETDELQSAMAATTAPPDFAALDQQADVIAGQILGAVPLQPMAWVVHDGRGLDARLEAGAERWRALGLDIDGDQP